jgi:hypothetical protein
MADVDVTPNDLIGYSVLICVHLIHTFLSLFFTTRHGDVAGNEENRQTANMEERWNCERT